MGVAMNHAACTVTDDAGHVVYLSRPAERIVSLSPDLTETLFAIGSGKQIVGVVSGSDYPPQAKKIPSIGSYSGIDLERTIVLHPDLIVVWGRTFAREVAALRKFSIPVYVSMPHRLADIPRTMQNLGCLTGRDAEAVRLAKHFRTELATLQQRYHTEHPVSVYYQIGAYSLFTINKDSWISDAIALCGGRNVFAHAHSVSPEISWEAVVAANPDVIIADTTDAHLEQRFRAFSTMTAVKNNAFHSIDPNLLDRPGPRLLAGVRQLCGFLHIFSAK